MGGRRMALVTFAARASHGAAPAQPWPPGSEAAPAGGAHDPKAARKWLVPALQRASDLASTRRATGFTASGSLAKYRQGPWKPEQARSLAVSAKVEVIPWVQSASGGVTIAGWF